MKVSRMITRVSRTIKIAVIEMAIIASVNVVAVTIAVIITVSIKVICF